MGALGLGSRHGPRHLRISPAAAQAAVRAVWPGGWQAVVVAVPMAMRAMLHVGRKGIDAAGHASVHDEDLAMTALFRKL